MNSRAAGLSALWLRAAQAVVGLFFATAILITGLSLPHKLQGLGHVPAGAYAATAFYGWNETQFQAVVRALNLAPQWVGGSMLAASLICLATYWGMAALLLWRRPGAVVGLFGAYILIGAGNGFSTLLLTQADIPAWAKGLLSANAGLVWPVFFLLPYLFPNGRFAPRFTRYLAPVPFVLSALATLVPELEGLATLVLMVYGVGAVASQVYRYRVISTAEERQQVKWIVFSLAVLMIIVVGGQGADGLIPASAGRGSFWYQWLWNGLLGVLTPALLPLALAISILRYRLWDIDLLIRRTLIYSVLTTLLALTYGGMVIVLQNIVSTLGSQQAEWVTVASTLAVAALFLPLRNRVQRFIDQRFFRRKYDAAQTLAAFALMARDETDVNALTRQLTEVVQETMEPESVGVWLKPAQPQQEPAA